MISWGRTPRPAPSGGRAGPTLLGCLPNASDLHLCRLLGGDCLGFAACGSSSSGGGGSDNGITSKSPDQIVTAVNSAVDNVDSVHVAGTVNSGGSKTTL